MTKDMEHQFDFDNIGKRMPYSVPEGFFDDMERQILARNLSQSHPRRHRSMTLRRSIAGLLAAAVVTGLVVMIGGRWSAPSTTDYAHVEQAFDNLSNDDQTYLLSVYQEDIFINE